MLSAIMLNVTYKPSMLSVVMLNAVKLSVVAPWISMKSKKLFHNFQQSGWYTSGLCYKHIVIVN
jgi:hypothetical protein